MFYILDTDHLSLFERRHPQVVARLQATPLPQRAITIITVEEQMRGRLSQIKKAHDASARIRACAALHETIRIFAGIRIIDYDVAAHARYETLRQRKLRIGTQDLRIAAVALATGSILITRNRSDFGQIPGLRIEDWTVS
jgi:tRNA(fMet)-specific endonuclease VapC